MKQFDVITVGDVFIDLVMTGFPHWPQPGEEIEAQQFRREIGGGAAITACGLARLGCRTAILAVVGQSDGEWFQAQLIAQGVNISELRRHPLEPTATTVAVSTAQDRSFFTYSGANRLLPELLRDPLTINSLKQARHIHLAHALVPDRLVEFAHDMHAAGTTISLDVGWVESWLSDPASLLALRHIDLFLPNEREAASLTGETEPEQMLRSFAARGIPRVALKLGESGACFYGDGQFVTADPMPVSPLDTTGAGDCFDAGFLFGWLNDHSPLNCLRLANSCGALSTRQLGGIAGFPALAEIEALGEPQL